MLPAIQRTPVEHLPRVSRAVGAEVWIKRDDLTHPDHGGNKVRKLAPLLEEALARGATDLLTLGAVGSNHVFATALHGARAGLTVHAALVPHPASPAVVELLEATRALGAELLPCRSEPAAAVRIALEWIRLRASGRRPYLVPPGGTCVAGVRGYLRAGRELAEQIAQRELPGWPDAIFCVLGSGGTAAGIWAALSEAGAPSRLHGVRVYASRLICGPYLRGLARRALGERWAGAPPLEIDPTQLGPGYGVPTGEASEAQALFAEDGVALDLTYTAKAAAALIRHARGPGRGQRLLFWHTLSAKRPPRPDGGLALPPEFQALLRA